MRRTSDCGTEDSSECPAFPESTDMHDILSRIARWAPHPHVKTSETDVVKRGPLRSIAVEAAKTRSARELAEETGLFRVPKIHAHDTQDGVIRFERLDGFVPIIQPIAYGRRGNALIERMAVVLALIHDRLVLPDEFREELVSTWRCKRRCTEVIHGDFNTDNLMYNKERDEIAIVDWSVSPLLGGEGSVGCRCVDVAWFAKSLFFRPAAYVFSHPPAPHADLFVNAYEQARGSPLDRAVLCEFGRHFWEVYVANLKRRRTGYWFHWRQQFAFRRYVERGM